MNMNAMYYSNVYLSPVSALYYNNIYTMTIQ